MQNQVWRRQRALLDEFELVTAVSDNDYSLASTASVATPARARIQPSAAEQQRAAAELSNKQALALRWYSRRLRPTTPSPRARPERTA
jgi:hypothetical protein